MTGSQDREGGCSDDSECNTETYGTYNNQAKQQVHENVRLSETDGTLLKQLLEWAYGNRKIVTVYYDDDTHELSGYLENPKGSRMKQVDIYDCDCEEGYSDIDISKAIAFCVDSSRAQDAGGVDGI